MQSVAMRLLDRLFYSRFLDRHIRIGRPISDRDFVSFGVPSALFRLGALRMTTLSPESSTERAIGLSPEFTGKRRITLVALSNLPVLDSCPKDSKAGDSVAGKPLPIADSCKGFSWASDVRPRWVQLSDCCCSSEESVFGFGVTVGSTGGVHTALGGVILVGSETRGGRGGLTCLAALGCWAVNRSQNDGLWRSRRSDPQQPVSAAHQHQAGMAICTAVNLAGLSDSRIAQRDDSPQANEDGQKLWLKSYK